MYVKTDALATMEEEGEGEGAIINYEALRDVRPPQCLYLNKKALDLKLSKILPKLNFSHPISRRRPLKVAAVFVNCTMF